MDSKKTYELKLKKLQQKLALIQQAYIQQGLRAVIVLEGVDAAGKGGLIRRISWSIDPRNLHVWPISASNEKEKGQHFLQRFWSRLPASGSIAIFDRSWYGRVLVERVEEFAKKKEWKRAYREINDFERSLCKENCRVIKILLKISKSEQRTRFADRIKDPTKHWKLSFEDFRNREKWSDYEEAYADMVDKTSSKSAKWNVIDNDSKYAARIKALELIVRQLTRGVSLKPKPVPKELLKRLSSN